MHKFLVVVSLATFASLTAPAVSATRQCHNVCVRTITDTNGHTTCQHYLQRCEYVNVPPTPQQRAELRTLNVEKKKNPDGLGPTPPPRRNR
jgi:hypothetical protein